LSTRWGCAVLRVLLFLVGITGPVAAQSGLGLPPGHVPAGAPVFNPANGHWYQAVQAPAGLTWYQARAASLALTHSGYPGHLITITSAAEQLFIERSLPVARELYWWTGAYQDTSAPDYREPDGGWRWVTGEPFVYTNWYPRQPDNDGSGENVLEFDAKLGNLWNDFPDWRPVSGYLVEFEPLTPPAGGSTAQVVVSPTSVVGGQTAVGQVILTQPAGPGGEVVTLSSSNHAAAVTPATVTVPAGSSSASFPIITFSVGTATAVTISAACVGFSGSATLTVLPTSGSPLLPPGHYGSPPVYNPVTGHWYQAVAVPAKLTWEEAHRAAQRLSLHGQPGHLVSITSAAENQFLLDRLSEATEGHWFIGGYQDERATDYREPAGGWRWVTGEPFVYTNWQSGEPNNAGGDEDRLHILNHGRWNDLGGSGGYLYGGYIVEYEAPLPQPPPSPAPAGGPVYNPANGHWYQAVRIAGTVTWPEARRVAETLFHQAYRGHLVTITSAAENQFVISLVNSLPGGPFDWWLGGFQDTSAPDYREPGGGWRWITGEPWGFAGWGQGEPNNTPNEQALHMSRFASHWNDLPESFPLSGFVVEYEATEAVPLPGNLLVNGSFETPRVRDGIGILAISGSGLPGWRVTHGTIDIIERWQQAPGQGRQSIDLVGSPSAAAIEQSFATEPGRKYRFSGWVSHNWGIPEGKANVQLDGVYFAQLYHNVPGRDEAMHWAQFSHEFTARSPITTLRTTDVTGLSEVHGIVLDGLSVLPVDGGGPVPPVPAAPTGLTAAAVSRDQINLAWRDNSSDETGFAIFRRTGGRDWERIALVGANITRFADWDVRPEFTYIYRVQAVNEAGASAWSNEASAATSPTPPPAAQPPAPPTALSAELVSATRVVLRWQDNSSDETGFGVWRRGEGGEWVRIGVAPANRPGFVDSTAQRGTRYLYRVRAHNRVGASAWTHEVAVTTPA
jgi:hypothetical protein